MSKALLILTKGFEETEAVTTLDILRRGNVEVTTAALEKELAVEGAHGLTVMADVLFEDLEKGFKENVKESEFDMIVLPGGPGTKNYSKHEALITLLKEYNDGGKKLAAICAAPSVLGEIGILRGKRAVCFPGFETSLSGAAISYEPVVTDGNITTSRGPGTAVDFALRLVLVLAGDEIEKEIRKGFLAKI